ncbi:MAG: AAA family ATPase [Desulfobacterota bacterium]|nr:AAA family ATPase [Thermodesulfobacteriota bacterium]
MRRWEHAFKGKGKNAGATDAAKQRIFAGQYSYEKPFPGRSVIPHASVAETPRIIKKLHRHLDDIWANIYLETHERQNVLMVCGAVPGEGCTFISFHLALFLALEHNLKVLYVDTDTGVDGSKPIIPGIEHMPGIASFFTSQHALPSLTLRSEYDNLFVLPSGFQSTGDHAQNKNSIFKKEAVESFLTYCRGNFDLTIIDSQPIAFHPMMIGFARPIGKVVLVCRYGYSRREVTKITIDKLSKNNINIIGVILNEREYPIPPWVYNILK